MIENHTLPYFDDHERPRCSIVVRCFNEEQHIGRLLSGIAQQTVRECEVIVVDSGSTDATVAIAEQYGVRLASIEPDAFSFGRSLNIGCEMARGEFIVICSAHVYPVYRDWLQRLLEPMDDPAVGLVYGKQRGNDVTRYSEHQMFERWFPDRSNFDQPHPFCNNANAVIRREIWEKIRYDEELTGLEDLDWAVRAREGGHKIAYCADAEIIHIHEETPRRILNRYRREAIALKQVIPTEHFSLWDFVRLFTKSVVSDYYHAWHDRVLTRNLYAIPMFRLMQYWGGYSGFRRSGPVSSDLKRTFYYPRALERSPRDEPVRDQPLVDYRHSREHAQGADTDRYFAGRDAASPSLARESGDRL